MNTTRQPHGATATTDRGPGALLALRPAAVFDGTTARLIPEPTVIVDRGRVVAVETGRVDVPASATLVDLAGCTLLPGLVDTHVHLCFDGGADPVGALADRDPAATLAAALTAARQQVRAGVTTVRDLGDRDYVALGVRDRSATETDLPTVVCAGPPITTPGGHCHFLGGAASGVAGVRAAVAEHVERGAEVIKVMASGGFLTPGSEPDVPQYGAAELRAIVDAAHRQGLSVTAHAHSLAAVEAAVDAGVDGIEHCTFLTADGVEAPAKVIDRIARRRIVVGATIGVLPGSTPPPFIADRLPAILAAHSRLRAAGVPVVAGTDAGLAPIKPHGVLSFAAPQLVEMGFAAAEALRAMTADAARVCGLGDCKGRIAPGFDADLVAVGGDPLTDLSILQAPLAVYRAGRPVALAVEDSP